MNAMKREKVVDKIIDILEGFFGILFMIGMTTADSPSLLVPILWVLISGSLFYAVYRVDEWRTWQKEERERRRQERIKELATR